MVRVQISKHSILKQTEILQTQNGHWVTLQKGSTPNTNILYHFSSLLNNGHLGLFIIWLVKMLCHNRNSVQPFRKFEKKKKSHLARLTKDSITWNKISDLTWSSQPSLGKSIIVQFFKINAIWALSSKPHKNGFKKS